jgi:hypothetical protein
MPPSFRRDLRKTDQGLSQKATFRFIRSRLAPALLDRTTRPPFRSPVAFRCHPEPGTARHCLAAKFRPALSRQLLLKRHSQTSAFGSPGDLARHRDTTRGR